MTVSMFDQGGGNGPGSLVGEIARLPGVKHVAGLVGLDVVPLTARGRLAASRGRRPAGGSGPYDPSSPIQSAQGG
jgi:hypothetical protein